MTRSAEAQQLRTIRQNLDAVAPGIWSRAVDGAGEFVEARGPMGELVPVARFHPGATAAEMEMMAAAPQCLRFLLGLVDRAIADKRRALGLGAGPAVGAPKAKDYAAEAAMKCQEPAFLAFLEQVHGLERPLTAERAAQRVRTLCGVSSRAELNTDAPAAQRWTALRGAFDAWKRGQ